jgi:ABC-2 type transport system ATP-binding protein
MIILNNVSKSFKGIPAVNNLSLQITEGEIYGLLGSNGAGKSTTLNMLLGFQQPDLGKAFIDGLHTSAHVKEVRSLTGYIPESVSLYPYLTGMENLAYFCKISGKKYADQELAGFLTECGLDTNAHQKRTETYSKGMRQKVGIAIAYAKNAKVYILDEPASGLDPVASNELSTLLGKLALRGATIVMASHDLFRVRETCTRIGIMKKGTLVKEMAAASVSASELENIYLAYMQD